MKQKSSAMKFFAVVITLGLTLASLTARAEFVKGHDGGILGRPTISPVGAITDSGFRNTLDPIAPSVLTESLDVSRQSFTAASPSQFSSQLLYFLSRFDAPRWGGNSAAFAYQNLLPQTLALSTQSPVPVPVPAAALLLISGLGGFVGYVRRRKVNGVISA